MEFKKLIESYKNQCKNYIPSFISKKEREYISKTLYPHYAILAHMVEKGFLKKPSKEEKKYMCTVIVEGEVLEKIV